MGGQKKEGNRGVFPRERRAVLWVQTAPSSWARAGESSRGRHAQEHGRTYTRAPRVQLAHEWLPTPRSPNLAEPSGPSQLAEEGSVPPVCDHLHSPQAGSWQLHFIPGPDLRGHPQGEARIRAAAWGGTAWPGWPGNREGERAHKGLRRCQSGGKIKGSPCSWATGAADQTLPGGHCAWRKEQASGLGLKSWFCHFLVV